MWFGLSCPRKAVNTCRRSRPATAGHSRVAHHHIRSLSARAPRPGAGGPAPPGLFVRHGVPTPRVAGPAQNQTGADVELCRSSSGCWKPEGCPRRWRSVRREPNSRVRALPSRSGGESSAGRIFRRPGLEAQAAGTRRGSAAGMKKGAPAAGAGGAPVSNRLKVSSGCKVRSITTTL